MYMANARNLRLGPNATYIPLTRVGGFALGDTKQFVSPNAKDTNMLVSFALGNAKVWPSQRQYPMQMVLHRSGIYDLVLLQMPLGVFSYRVSFMNFENLRLCTFHTRGR